VKTWGRKAFALQIAGFSGKKFVISRAVGGCIIATLNIALADSVDR